MTSVCLYLFVLVIISSVSDVKSKSQSIEEKIKHDSDLSEVGFPITIFFFKGFSLFQLTLSKSNVSDNTMTVTFTNLNY